MKAKVAVLAVLGVLAAPSVALAGQWEDMMWQRMAVAADTWGWGFPGKIHCGRKRCGGSVIDTTREWRCRMWKKHGPWGPYLDQDGPCYKVR